MTEGGAVVHSDGSTEGSARNEQAIMTRTKDEFFLIKNRTNTSPQRVSE
jgi:hypothetical protein